MADTDYLTGLMNRRAFLAVADDTVEFCRRYKRGMATLMIDIDHFKKINDAHGHAAGDDAIKRIAEIINQSIRTTDKAARFGGEEFVVLLREIDQETALLLAERIRSSIEQTAISHGVASIPGNRLDRRCDQREGDRDVQDMIERGRSRPLCRQADRPQSHRPDAGISRDRMPARPRLNPARARWPCASHWATPRRPASRPAPSACPPAPACARLHSAV
jgi:diguanylate cyclase (GGDEF)-like protein